FGGHPPALTLKHGLSQSAFQRIVSGVSYQHLPSIHYHHLLNGLVSRVSSLMSGRSMMRITKYQPRETPTGVQLKFMRQQWIVRSKPKLCRENSPSVKLNSVSYEICHSCV